MVYQTTPITQHTIVIIKTNSLACVFILNIMIALSKRFRVRWKHLKIAPRLTFFKLLCQPHEMFLRYEQAHNYINT